jgi:hypothetical protein
LNHTTLNYAQKTKEKHGRTRTRVGEEGEEEREKVSKR